MPSTASPTSRSRTPAHRAWIWLHKWLGLIAGGLLALLGLTGAINVFYRELDVLLHPALFAATASLHPIGARQALAIAAGAVPDPIRFVRAPDPVMPVWTALFRRHGDLWTLTIDPGTGRVLGLRDLDRSLLRIIYRLHSSLLLKRYWGEQAIGVCGLILLTLSASGLWLWWPRRSFWRALVSLRTRPRQILYLDLHALAGAWSALMLLMVSLAGVGVVFPGLLRPAVALLSPVAPRTVAARPDPGTPMLIDADRAVGIALAAAPTETLGFVAAPDDRTRLWQIGLRWRDGSPADLVDGVIWIDPWTGAIAADRSAQNASLGTQYMDAQLWLHNGSEFGLAGRLLVLLAGLSLPTLFLTGLLLWLRKRHNRRQLDRRRALASNQTKLLIY